MRRVAKRLLLLLPLLLALVAPGPGARAVALAFPAQLAARASGAVPLVTPAIVSTSVAASLVVPVFGLLSLHFAPEPGSLLLLGAGTTMLAARARAAARRKWRSS